MNLFIANVISPNGEQFKSDKNGNFPVMLNVLSGKCPFKRVIAGTVAIDMEIEPGKSYLFSWEELEKSETYGRQFRFSAAKELTALDIVLTSKELGKGELLDAPKSSVVINEEVTESDFEGKTE